MPLGAPYVVTLSPDTVRRLAALMAAAPVMAKYYEIAMAFCVNAVKTEAVQVAQTVFANPTGTLARGITGRVISPFHGVVGVGEQIPYARRREFGFSGMTDSLGRYYPNDPGAFYLQTALRNKEPLIAETFLAQTALAIRELGATGL